MTNQNPAENLRQQISAILVKWSMPTRQGAVNEIMQLVTAYAAIVEREARQDELLEIGLLAHKFEGEDYHCREIADAIDNRLAALQGPQEPDDTPASS